MASNLPSSVSDSCHARVGLMGNPSDGFKGKTLSFLLENYKATVFITEKLEDSRIELAEPVFFDSLDSLLSHTRKVGYTSGMRLMQATCKVFTELCNKSNHTVHKERGFKMTYTTDIPRMVGLSGSSAIVVAAFRCLLKFHGITIADLGISKTEFPQVILNIEKVELGISAGLQDRVIQTYGGLVHMDFTPTSNPASPYTSLDPALLPDLYLAYDLHAGGDSGVVHNTVRARWEAADPELVQGMQQLGRYADQAALCVRERHYSELATLMEHNFKMRLRIYGEAVVGHKNLQMVQLAEELGLAAKFTGSGGALVCLRKDGLGFYNEEEESIRREAFHLHGFAFVRVAVHSHSPEVEQKDIKK